jgi:hypothetical protein
MWRNSDHISCINDHFFGRWKYFSVSENILNEQSIFLTTLYLFHHFGNLEWPVVRQILEKKNANNQSHFLLIKTVHV